MRNMSKHNGFDGIRQQLFYYSFFDDNDVLTSMNFLFGSFFGNSL